MDDEIVLIRKKERNKGIWAIVLYFVLTFLFAIGLVVVKLVLGGTVSSATSDSSMTMALVVPEAILFIIFIFMYRKTLRSDFKSLTKREYKIIGLGIAATFLANIVIGIILAHFNVTNDNQDILDTFFNKYPLFIFIDVAFIGPLVEEIVFRKAISSIIRNDIAFVVVSSIIFGVMHGVGIATILYVFMGALWAVIFIKVNKNVMATTMVHMANNLVAALLLLLSLVMK